MAGVTSRSFDFTGTLASRRPLLIEQDPIYEQLVNWENEACNFAHAPHAANFEAAAARNSGQAERRSHRSRR